MLSVLTYSLGANYTHGYFVYSQCFEIQYRGYFRTGSISGFDTEDTTCTSSFSGFCTIHINTINNTINRFPFGMWVA